MITLSKKICLLGDFAVGKTSLVRRFVHSTFDDKYLSTIGVKVSRKVISVPHDGQVIELTMMLWDLAGAEEFNGVRASYLRGAAGAILVCDLTRPATLETLYAYRDDLYKAGLPVPVVVVGNKADLVAQQQLTEKQIGSVATRLQAECYITSAKTGQAVEAAFRHLAGLIV